MGKLIQFPASRLQRRRAHVVGMFSAFRELEQVERAQARLFGACAGCTLLLTFALHLAAR